MTRQVLLSATLGLVVHDLVGEVQPKSPTAAPQRGTVRLPLTAPRYRLAETTGGRHRIDIDGFARASVPGAPALPFTILEVEVPAGVRKEFLRLQPEGLATRAIPGSFRIEEATGASSTGAIHSPSSRSRMLCGPARRTYSRESRSSSSTW